MAANSMILKEYLLSLGFKVDETSSRRFDTTLKGFDFSVAGLAKKLLGVASAAQVMVAVFANSMEKLYYASKRMGATAGNVQALEFGARQIGISGETMRASLEGMARAMRANPGLQGLLENFGIQVTGRGVDKVMVDFVKALKGMPFYQAQQYASMFGVDPDTLLMLQDGIEELEKAADLRRKMASDAGVDIDAAAKAGKDYAKTLREIYELFGLLKDASMIALLPAATEVAAVTKIILSDWTKIIAQWKGYKDFGTRLWEGITGKPTGGGVVLSPGSVARINAGETRPPTASSSSSDPLGIRNNNPGNLRSWPGAQTSGGFAKFDDPAAGLGAMAQNLLTYFRKYGLDTIRGIIKRWAPSSENNTGAYINSVSKMMGVDGDAKLDLTDPRVLASLMQSITTHENGKNPYDPSAFTGAATSRLGGVNMHQTTSITVNSPDPASAGVAVAGAQDRVNSTLTRNLGTAVK